MKNENLNQASLVGTLFIRHYTQTLNYTLDSDDSAAQSMIEVIEYGISVTYEGMMLFKRALIKLIAAV